jgi:transposase-like protein
MARQLGISQEQIRIWFQNRRRLQTQRDSGQRSTTSNELVALQQGKRHVNGNELRQLLQDIAKYKDAPPRARLDDSL